MNLLGVASGVGRHVLGMKAGQVLHGPKVGGHPCLYRRVAVDPARRRVLADAGFPAEVGLFPVQRGQGLCERLGCHCGTAFIVIRCRKVYPLFPLMGNIAIYSSPY